MRTAIKILSLLLIVFLIWNVYVYIAGRDTTAPAVRGTVRDYVSAEGHLIKRETLIHSPSDGVLQPYVSDCEKVSRGMAMAAVLSGETDESARAQMTVVKERIAALEETMARGDSFKDDILGIDAIIGESLADIVRYAARGKMTNISEHKNEIAILSDRRSVMMNGNGDELLEQLLSRRREIESRLGNIINEIYAPVAGVFTARTDGLEETLTPERMGELTAADIDDIKNVSSVTQSRVSRGDAVCKLIDNFEWYMAVVLAEDEAADIEEGKYLKIAFRDANSEEVSACVHRVAAPENGRTLVIFRLNRDLNGILHRRHVSVDIIRSTYSGLKLPPKSLCVKDGVTGVYVANGDGTEFREAELLYRGEDCIIVAEDNAKEGGILLYDNVLVNGAEK